MRLQEQVSNSLEHQDSHKKVDCIGDRVRARPEFRDIDSQTPRPKKECMKLAYLWMMIFCSSVGVRTSTASVAAPKLNVERPSEQGHQSWTGMTDMIMYTAMMIDEKECLIKFPTAPTIMNPPTPMFTNLRWKTISAGQRLGEDADAPQQLCRVFSESVHGGVVVRLGQRRVSVLIIST